MGVSPSLGQGERILRGETEQLRVNLIREDSFQDKSIFYCTCTSSTATMAYEHTVYEHVTCTCI